MTFCLGYAAGLFDGEGHVRFQQRPGRKGSLVAVVAMTDREPLEHLQEATGMGRIYGPYEHGWKPYWQWQASGHERVQALTAQLWSFLSPRRRRQFTDALLLWRSERA